MDEPRFTDEQARQIFEAAAAAQESSATSLVHADRGYTLAELQDIAGEVGIDKDHVTAAATAVSIRSSQPPPYLRWAGVPGEVEVQGVVDSEITDEEWEYMVLERQTGQFKRVLEQLISIAKQDDEQTGGRPSLPSGDPETAG